MQMALGSNHVTCLTYTSWVDELLLSYGVGLEAFLSFVVCLNIFIFFYLNILVCVMHVKLHCNTSSMCLRVGGELILECRPIFFICNFDQRLLSLFLGATVSASPWG